MQRGPGREKDISGHDDEGTKGRGWGEKGKIGIASFILKDFEIRGKEDQEVVHNMAN